MASDGKKENIDEQQTETNEQAKSQKDKKNKARYFRSFKDRVARAGTFSYVLPSYHVGAKSVGDELSLKFITPFIIMMTMKVTM
ncbi:hypothetical protein JCM19232_1552 [Vibrio ishigakensis]|uniref:Uncharacterized protein n=1 Tax=Vibrio ishigakensis TaxID=1481914 RepID=A0A0B8P9E0_9VIBR|nr:hypothetical protein JCM19232_1552 [Vibrio ishigakensis]